MLLLYKGSFLKMHSQMNEGKLSHMGLVVKE